MTFSPAEITAILTDGPAQQATEPPAPALPPGADGEIHAAAQKSAKHSQRSTIARPKAVTRKSGTNVPRSNTERSESFAVAKSR